MIKITSDIPAPKRSPKYILKKLNVGDSFLLERRNVANLAKSLGIEIATRKEGDMYRIWRIA